jgi:para-aminobenzoate synthetase/4-amino-4-deoxychorismate lyase
MNISLLFESHLRQRLISGGAPFVFLETSAFDRENKNSFLFNDFVDILVFNYQDSPERFFRRINACLEQGLWLCGYFSYEFGYALEPALRSLLPRHSHPLAWLAVSREPTVIAQKRPPFIPTRNTSHCGRDSALRQPERQNAAAVRPQSFISNNHDSPLTSPRLNYRVEKITPNITQQEYSEGIKRIKQCLREGYSYQVNFTFKMNFDFRGDVFSFYVDLRRSQPTPYAALIHTGSETILSLSPELFFRTDGRQIITRPMKGTIPRGLSLKDDARAAKMLQASQKTRAENVMIVDLLRNDLGRVADKVWVPRLFSIEQHRTLYQMTSTIQARLKKDAGFKEIFSSLFPCGSVTGAPKIKTMEIIKELEKEPRGVYTGAIGYISPKRVSCFNVAIRTIRLKKDRGELGIGGGIVYDSLDKEEYKEALLKAQFFMKGFPELKLIETMRWSREEGYFLLDRHLERLKNSCRYFSVPLSVAKLKQELEKTICCQKGPLKVRVLLGLKGGVDIEKEPLADTPLPVRVIISRARIDPDNCFLYHKTTQRDLYSKESREAKARGLFEVIYLNVYGELTEGATTSIFLLKNGRLYTPPLYCGLLPGVLREHLLAEGQAEESVLRLDDLREAEGIFVGNSLRGLLPAELVSQAPEVKGSPKVQLSGRM